MPRPATTATRSRSRSSTDPACVSRHSIAALAGLAALFALSSAGAGTFTISPLRVDFTGAASTAALTVRNEEAAPVVVQAEGLAWSQDGGQDAFQPTRDLLVSPAVFTLAPGGSQLVRVALRRGPDATRELSYRMMLQEVPQAASPDFTGLQVALRLSIPVFVAPLAPSAPRARMERPDGQRRADDLGRPQPGCRQRAASIALRCRPTTARRRCSSSPASLTCCRARAASGPSKQERIDPGECRRRRRARRVSVGGKHRSGRFRDGLMVTAD